MKNVTVRWIWILGMLVGCGGAGGNGGVDADPETARCAALSEEWRVAWRALDNRCTTPDDCMVVGEPGGCDCRPTVSGDCGVAVARASYEGSEAERLAGQFDEGCTFPSSCQCAPTLADCSPEGQCVFTNQFCSAASDGNAGHEAAQSPASSGQ